MHKSFKLALAAGVGSFTAGELQAAVSYTNPGPYEDTNFGVADPQRYAHQYKQFFDTLPNSPENASLQGTKPWVDDVTPTSSQSSIPGWYLYHPIPQATEGGTNTHQRLRAGPGSQTTGAFWSYGPSGNGDRALGALNADTLSTPSDAATPPATLEDQEVFIGLRLHNDSGQTLTQFTLKYDGEQWRRSGNNATTEKLDFQYSLDPSATINSPNSLYTDVNSLDFAAPNNLGAAGNLDGNAVGNRTVLGPITVTGINWAPGTDLWLRWVDLNLPGADSAARADAGLAIDNLGFSADVPEPTGLALLALGAAGLVSRRRNA